MTTESSPRAAALKRLQLNSLLYTCPSGSCNPTLCQLHEIRKLPIAERVAWANRLPDSEVLRLFEHHCECLKIQNYLEAELNKITEG